MSRRFEKSLSLILVILIMVELVITGYANIAGGSNKPILSEIWNISFLITWIGMFVYGLYILFQKDSKGFSILTAIISAISFIFLSYHGLIMGARYLAFMPNSLAVSNNFLLANGQVIFYTALFAVYIFQLINLVKINNDQKDDGEEKEKETLDVEENTSESVYLIDNDRE